MVSECVPEPVPLAYVTTVLPAAGGGGGGLPHHPLPQLAPSEAPGNMHFKLLSIHLLTQCLILVFPCRGAINLILRQLQRIAPYLAHQLPLYMVTSRLSRQQHTHGQLAGQLELRQVRSCGTLSHHMNTLQANLRYPDFRCPCGQCPLELFWIF